MALSNIINRQSPESGLTAKHDRQHKFRLSRKKDEHGFHVYTLENYAKNERILVRRFIFDRFRAAVRDLVNSLKAGETPIDIKIQYKAKPFFTIKSDAKSADAPIIIQEVKAQGGASGHLTISRDALATLDGLLYHDRLMHPNDVLNRIVSYHKLFQFTFAEGSESITSDLALRKDVLSATEAYVPSLGKRIGDVARRVERSDADDSADAPKRRGPGGEEAAKKGLLFKSRLAEKSGAGDYQVNYEALFSRQQVAESISAAKGRDDNKRQANKNRHAFALPILASDVKSLTQSAFRCEFSTEEIKELRDQFLDGKSDEYFLGFEVMDAIFRGSSGKLRSFRFPLYYLKVTVKESGRFLYLEPSDEGRAYLNHLALANLLETFGRAPAGVDPVDRFFKTLLAQKIEVAGTLSRIHLSRLLPFADEIFDRTREVLLGFPGENGKGGLLAGLAVAGIECDLESVYLYKSPKISSPLTAALEGDLDAILAIAHETPKRFYRSLLGQFLSPETKPVMSRSDKSSAKASASFCDRPWVPGALPKSTRRLIDKLNDHDVVLLEGPPGTGKTFTIMNLFLHCLCSGKRLLVVSDQKAAIHALTEKVQEYLMGRDRESSEAKHLDNLWRSAIKVVDQIPAPTAPIATWVRDLRAMLGLDNAKEIGWPDDEADLEAELKAVDRKIDEAKSHIQAIMLTRLGPDADIRRRVTPKRLHATTVEDIESLVAFLRFMGNGSYDQADQKPRNQSVRWLILRFIKDREFLAHRRMSDVYPFFVIPRPIEQEHIERLSRTEDLLQFLQKKKPRSLSGFLKLVAGQEINELTTHLKQRYEKAFPPDASGLMKTIRVVASLFQYPLKATLKDLERIVKNQKKLFKLGNTVEPGVWRQLTNIHQALTPGAKGPIPLSLEICRFTTESTFSTRQKEWENETPSIQESVERIGELQKRRDALIRRRVLLRLATIGATVFKTDEQSATSPATTILSLLDSLKAHDTIESAQAVLQDLQEKLYATFPIWVCRKQAVPFLFPCKEKSFDLIIVDEATQCRVDDALPLLFRARRLMVVGDEKQTVLAKNSVIDDYLFNEFNLDEHLRSTQARGIKGGGSHIFGLVKAIKQASVMLDEHYRCPPDIIEYSNRYVYGGELKTMQWSPIGKPPAVIVDYSESKVSGSSRRDYGQYKGIETEMVDRYLKFVEKTILQIEKETGTRINVETDVALCYFLLKNEPYVKSVKGDFLARLGRGNDILDGAGAALQGKERDYIFYLWDVTRGNMMAFRQGDDEDKRKGELNVLMSRPKRRAYHYLHHDFAKLDHNKASITDFLWRRLQKSQERVNKEHLIPRSKRPGPEFIPWRRSSGQLMGEILKEVGRGRQETIQRALRDDRFTMQYSVIVGDPKHRVDLMLLTKDLTTSGVPAVGVVDLCGFEANEHCADEIVDYYFQLGRASPGIRPVFLFMHELADERARGFRQLEKVIAEVLDRAARRAS